MSHRTFSALAAGCALVASLALSCAQEPAPSGNQPNGSEFFTLLKPNGGQTYHWGDTIDVEWRIGRTNSDPGCGIYVFLVFDDLEFHLMHITSADVRARVALPDSSNFFLEPLPQEPVACRIRVRDCLEAYNRDSLLRFDDSDQPITIMK